MRRLPTVLLLAVLALSTVAFAPAPLTVPAAEQLPASQDSTVQEVQARQVIVCVKFRDWEVPLTGITWEAPYERFCVDTPSVPGQQQ